MIENSFCFFTLGDITNKEEVLVESLLSLFNIDYYNINSIVTEYDKKNPLLLLEQIINYGIENVIIDIKTGFDYNDESAKDLVKEILNVSKKYNISVTCFITSLNLSLGTSFGTDLEKIEISKLLNESEYSLLLKLSVKITSFIAYKSNNLTLEDNQNKIVNYLKNQDRNSSTDSISSNRMFSIKSSQTGFVKNINVFEIDDLLNKLGRDDARVGIVFTKQIGDYVLENEELAKVYLNEKDILASEVLDCFEIATEMGKVDSLIKEIVG